MKPRRCRASATGAAGWSAAVNAARIPRHSKHAHRQLYVLEPAEIDYLADWHRRSGAYDQTAHVIGDQEYRAVVPFPVTIVPSKLVTTG